MFVQGSRRMCVRKSECARERERKRKKEMGECEEGRAERRKERKRMEEIGLCVYVCERGRHSQF